MKAHTIGVPGGINGQIAMHSHVYGDVSDMTGGSVGGHWNLDNALHGLPGVNAARHLGTLLPFFFLHHHNPSRSSCLFDWF